MSGFKYVTYCQNLILSVFDTEEEARKEVVERDCYFQKVKDMSKTSEEIKCNLVFKLKYKSLKKEFEFSENNITEMEKSFIKWYEEEIRKSFKLYQCPYNEACKCAMIEPCVGCIDFARYQQSKTTLTNNDQ